MALQLSGDASRRCLLDAQIALHKTALDALEDTLISEADNAALRAQLQQMRNVVAARLDRAEDIEDDLD